MTDRIVIEVGKDGWTGALQLSISKLDENGVGHGRRLAGPKFNGSTKPLLSRELDERDADEIRAYLNAVFPQRVPERVVDGPGAETHPGVAAELEHAQATLARVHDVLGQLHSMAAGTMFPAYRDACLDVAGLLVAALKGGE